MEVERKLEVESAKHEIGIYPADVVDALADLAAYGIKALLPSATYPRGRPRAISQTAVLAPSESDQRRVVFKSSGQTPQFDLVQRHANLTLGMPVVNLEVLAVVAAMSSNTKVKDVIVAISQRNTCDGFLSLMPKQAAEEVKERIKSLWHCRRQALGLSASLVPSVIDATIFDTFVCPTLKLFIESQLPKGARVQVIRDGDQSVSHDALSVLEVSVPSFDGKDALESNIFSRAIRLTQAWKIGKAVSERFLCSPFTLGRRVNAMSTPVAPGVSEAALAMTQYAFLHRNSIDVC